MLYRISTLVPALPEDARFWFAIVLRTTMTLFDLGSLILMYGMSLQIGTRSRAVRAAGLFAAGFVIAYAASGWYDSMPLFFLLLALYLGLRDRWKPDVVHLHSQLFDYAGIGPEHAYLRDTGRGTFDFATDDEALNGFLTLSKLEGNIPALESAHAVAHAMKVAPKMRKDELIIVNLSGRGDKDVSQVAERILQNC